MTNNWFKSIPVYVTNKTSEGLVASFSVTLWIAVLIEVLIVLNAIGWGVYGLVALVGQVV